MGWGLILSDSMFLCLFTWPSVCRLPACPSSVCMSVYPTVRYSRLSICPFTRSGFLFLSVSSCMTVANSASTSRLFLYRLCLSSNLSAWFFVGCLFFFYWSVDVSGHVFVCLSISLPLCLPSFLFVCLTTACHSVSLDVYIPVYLPVCFVFLRVSVYASVCQSTYLPVNL
jgi:hypothetical protein